MTNCVARQATHRRPRSRSRDDRSREGNRTDERFIARLSQNVADSIDSCSPQSRANRLDPNESCNEPGESGPILACRRRSSGANSRGRPRPGPKIQEDFALTRKASDSFEVTKHLALAAPDHRPRGWFLCRTTAIRASPDPPVRRHIAQRGGPTNSGDSTCLDESAANGVGSADSSWFEIRTPNSLQRAAPRLPERPTAWRDVSLSRVEARQRSAPRNPTHCSAGNRTPGILVGLSSAQRRGTRPARFRVRTRFICARTRFRMSCPVTTDLSRPMPNAGTPTARHS
jgi:hypothetical protein